ncbi:MAG TPA: hypothetical protein VHM01_02330 [Alphaproteobacteria bacterium]|nr:hypothetical protein [Alphaproteobacteria bacterium]
MAEETSGASRGTPAQGAPQAIDQLKTDLRSLRSDLETAARTVNQLGGAAASEAMQQAQAQMQEIQHRIELLLEDAQDYGDRYAEELRQYVQQRPFQSILIAMAAGFTLAHLFSRR